MSVAATGASTSSAEVVASVPPTEPTSTANTSPSKETDDIEDAIASVLAQIGGTSNETASSQEPRSNQCYKN